MTKLDKEIESAGYWYAQERKWMEDHGSSLTAYIQRYGSFKDPDHYGEGGEAIYAADKDALDRRHHLFVSLLVKRQDAS